MYDSPTHTQESMCLVSAYAQILGKVNLSDAYRRQDLTFTVFQNYRTSWRKSRYWLCSGLRV